MVTVQDVLSAGDPAAGVELLLNLLSQCASGRDLSGTVSDVLQLLNNGPQPSVASAVAVVLQGVFGRSGGHPQVRKLTYELCRLTQLSEADVNLLLVGIKSDMNKENAEVAAAAISCLVLLPAQQLASMLAIGDLLGLLGSATSLGAEATAAAVTSFGRILMLPEVLHTVAANPGLMMNLQEGWGQVADALLDADLQAVGAAAGAIAHVLVTAQALDTRTVTGEVLQAVVANLALRVASALGPVLEGCSAVPGVGQVSVCRMLAVLLQSLSREPSVASSCPSIATLAALVSAYLLERCRSADLAVRIEACKGILAIYALFQSQDTVGTAQHALLPAGWPTEAVNALLEVKDMQLAEAALGEVVTAVAASLPCLPVAMQSQVLSQLWPLIARVQQLPERLLAYSLAWQAAIEQSSSTDKQATAPPAPANPATDDTSDPFAQLTAPTPSTSTAQLTQRHHRLQKLLADPYFEGLLSGQGLIPVAGYVQQNTGPAAGPTGGSGKGEPTSRPSLSESDKKPSGKGLFSFKREDPHLDTTSKSSYADLQQRSSGELPSPKDAPSKLSQPSPARHEAVLSLLEVMLNQPYAQAARQLCSGADAAARQDRSLTPGDGDVGRQYVGLVQWLSSVGGVLQATAVCLLWEPRVPPAISAQITAASYGHASADFNCAVPDGWLQLAQLACQTVHAIMQLLRAQPVTILSDLGDASASGILAHSPSQLMLAAVEQESRELQILIRKVLKEWPKLSRAVRLRVMWVAAHFLELPGFMDEGWQLLCSCLEDLLTPQSSGGPVAAVRAHELMASAAAGHLHRTARAMHGRDKPFVFDVAAASALCELPEYEVGSVLVGLCALQHLALQLNNGLSAATPTVAARIHSEISAVAKRLDLILKGFQGDEQAGAPQVKEWCKHIHRMLATILLYAPPKDGADSTNANGDTNGDGAANDYDDSSSDQSAEYEPPPPPVNLPPPMPAAPPPPAGVNPVMAAVAAAHLARNDYGRRQLPNASIDDAAAGNSAAAAEDDGLTEAIVRGGRGNSSAQGVTSSSYVVKSHAPRVWWGYPFGGPRASVLSIAKRSRRYRNLVQHMGSAVACLEMEASAVWSCLHDQPKARSSVVRSQMIHNAPAAQTTSPHRRQSTPSSATLSTQSAATQFADGSVSGPVLSSSSAFRLDSEGFWYSLPGSHGRLHELTGGGDPLLLEATCSCHPDDAAVRIIRFTATNQLSVDLQDVAVHVKTSGPLLTDRRAITWHVPRLSAGDKATHTLELKALGYGLSSVDCKLQLTPAVVKGEAMPLEIACQPLHIPAVLMLQWPQAVPDVADFSRTWVTLPARGDVSGMCVWPGLEGLQLCMSALLRQPIACVMMDYLPATGCYQAAFVAGTCFGDSMSLLVIGQLLPAVGTGIPHALCHVSVRSQNPDLVLSCQSHPNKWLNDLTDGTAQHGLAHPQLPWTTRPPIHPHVMSLQQRYQSSLRTAKMSTNLSNLGDRSLGDLELFSTAGLRADAAASGSVVSQAWLRSSSMTEWQRMVSLG